MKAQLFVFIKLLLYLLQLVMGCLNLLQFVHALHRLVRLFDFLVNVFKILSCSGQLFANICLRLASLFV